MGIYYYYRSFDILPWFISNVSIFCIKLFYLKRFPVCFGGFVVISMSSAFLLSGWTSTYFSDIPFSIFGKHWVSKNWISVYNEKHGHNCGTFLNGFQTLENSWQKVSDIEKFDIKTREYGGSTVRKSLVEILCYVDGRYR